mgnify:CR=1 FL=1
MDKWEKVFKYAVYMAYEIVAHARCPRGPVWHRPEAKMFNLLLPQLLRLRKQIDQTGAGLRQPICLNVVAGDNVLLETWTVRLKPHDLAQPSASPTSGMSKALLELSVFLRSLQSYVHVLPAAARSLRNRNETYTITLSVPGKQRYANDARTTAYPFKGISSPLGIFEFSVTYREKVETFANNRAAYLLNEALAEAGGDSSDSPGIIKDYIPGPSPLTRVSSNPRQIPTSKRAPSTSSGGGGGSSYNDQGRDRAFSYGTGLGHLSSSNFSVGTPPLHPSSMGSHGRWPQSYPTPPSTAAGHHHLQQQQQHGYMPYRNSPMGHFIGSTSPSPGTPPFLAGSLKSSSASPFYKNLPMGITGSSPPFHGMVTLTSTTPSGGTSHRSGAHGSSGGHSGGSLGYRMPKPTPSPPGPTYFLSSSLAASSLAHGNASRASLTHSGLATGASSGSGEIVHSPWGSTLGVVAQRAGKECRYGKIDTTWILHGEYPGGGDGDGATAGEETLGWHDDYMEHSLLYDLLTAPQDLVMRSDRPMRAVIELATKEIESAKSYLNESGAGRR